MKTMSLGAYHCKGGKGQKSEVDGEEGERGPDVNHTNYTAFISEYSSAIDEEHTRQKNDKNRGRNQESVS